MTSAEPLHVAVISPYPPAGEHYGGHSGVASYTADLARALTSRGADVTVLAPRLPGDPASFTDGGVKVHRCFDLGPRALTGAAAAVRQLAATERVDVVHLQWELFLYGGAVALPGLFPALATLRRCRLPLVVTAHQVVDPSQVDRRYTELHRVHVPAVAARAGIATVQRAIRNAATATIVHEQAFTGVIDGARMIALGVEEVEPLDREAAREALGLDDRFVALCFGFVAPYKGIDIALEAARLAGPSVRLVVAGGEHPRMSGTNSYADELRRRYSETAHFTGWVDDGDVARWFAAADLALFPYPRPFSSSGVLALALAYRTPFLLSPALARCAGAPSIVSAPVEPVALAERLKLLASKPEALDQLRWWADVLASGRRWPEVAAEHEALYRELTDG